MKFEIPAIGSEQMILVDADVYEVVSKMRWRMITHTHGTHVRSCSNPFIPLTRIIFGIDGGRIIRQTGDAHDYRRQHFKVYPKEGKPIKSNPRPVYMNANAGETARKRWQTLSDKPKQVKKLSKVEAELAKREAYHDVNWALLQYGLSQPQQLSCQGRRLEVG